MESSVLFCCRDCTKKTTGKGGGAQLLKKKGILKKGVKRGDRTTFSTKKNIAEENIFNHDVVGSARFGPFFQSFFFTQTYTQASYVVR